MSEIENGLYAWVEVDEKDLDAFVQHLSKLCTLRKTIRFVVSVDTKTIGSSVYGRVFFPGDQVDPGLIVNHGVTANDSGNSARVAARNSQMTTNEIVGRNVLVASANKQVPRNPRGGKI